MSSFLSSSHFPSTSDEDKRTLQAALDDLLQTDLKGSYHQLLASYQRILADNCHRDKWPEIHEKLTTLFKCGKSVPIDGPMIGISVSIRDSDYFKETVARCGRERSRIASIEWMATLWNMSFADTGLWMGKTFESVSRETVAEKCGNNKSEMKAFDPKTTRIGRNFFREPVSSDFLKSLGLPVLTQTWHLRDRPQSPSAADFNGTLTAENLEREINIPYTKTGGYFLCNNGKSVVPEMKGKKVYQLNYRWPALGPAYPMTRLVDELVQVADGVYLGQLVYATKHYSLGSLRQPFCPHLPDIPIGEPYNPEHRHPLDFLKRIFRRKREIDYGYQNNGYFLMLDPAHAEEIYADDAFPRIRPRAGESGYVELGYDKTPAAAVAYTAPSEPKINWINGWREDPEIKEKFTTFILEPSPKGSDPDDVQEMRRDDESILQMLKRISEDISTRTKTDDRLRHFEKLNRLFRRGIAPGIENGVFRGQGKQGFNIQAEGRLAQDWYGRRDVAHGFDYYHGANLNLHLGFSDNFRPNPTAAFSDSQLFPSAFASVLGNRKSSANILDITWHSIGKYIFPWAGKSYEKISGRKLSMLLDESHDLAKRYPQRVGELKSLLASAPHADLVARNKKGRRRRQRGQYAAHLKSGAWDKGMSDADKSFWEQEANDRWVFGHNTEDNRILTADPLMHVIDMNYRIPDPYLQGLSEAGPSPFARQGYIFLGTSDRESILPQNSGEERKRVFQFHYRFPLIGGPVPIGFCLDEIVEIADGLFLGQLIYSTAWNVPFHSSVDPARYKYQLFGYFLLMDDAWQHHRLAIELDTVGELAIAAHGVR
ncbi:MAG: hypothetical protein GY835_03750 [bacterium]|nr:hypothetical protein [bacterium]